MIEIVEAKREHLEQVLLDEYNKGMVLPSNAIDTIMSSRFKYSVLKNGNPIAILGVFEIWEGRGEGWAFFTKNNTEYFPRIIRAAKRFMKGAPYRRIEATVRCNFEEGHRMMRLLGFNCERYEMLGYGPTGEPYSAYALVKGGY